LVAIATVAADADAIAAATAIADATADAQSIIFEHFSKVVAVAH
jgi:hypothetical protein